MNILIPKIKDKTIKKTTLWQNVALYMYSSIQNSLVKIEAYWQNM